MAGNALIEAVLGKDAESGRETALEVLALFLLVGEDRWRRNLLHLHLDAALHGWRVAEVAIGGLEPAELRVCGLGGGHRRGDG